MANELLNQGVDLMLVGMGVVFVFLALLIIATGLMSKIVGTYFPEPTPATPSRAAAPESSPDIPDDRILAAIKAAIAEHRKSRA